MELSYLFPLLEITDLGLRFIGAGIAMGLGGFAPALGIAFAEAIAIYALVVAVMIGFVF